MPDISKSKDFSFPNIIDDFGGYVSSVDKTLLSPNLMAHGSLNMYKKLSGTLAVRPGQKRQGAADSTLSACSSEFVWENSGGVTLTMVVSDSTLWVVSDAVWYPLLTGLTKTRYVFDTWWDDSEKQDVLLFVNGTDDMFEWPGGFGLVSGRTVDTIVLDRTIAASRLPATGTVIIDGVTYTYTGASGSTLTGVTPDPSSITVGSGVLQPVTTNTNTPAADFLSDFIRVINNQVYVGSYTSRLTYISADDDYTDYTVPTPRVAGSPELVVLDGVGNGIGVRGGNAHIGFGPNGWAIVSFQDITVGTDLVNVTTVTVKPVAVLQAPMAHEFIDMVGDNIVYLAQDQQVRVLGDFNNLFVAGYPSLSQEIATELVAQNFSGGSLKCIGEFIYLAAPATGTVYLRQERTRVDENGNVVAERLWHAPFTWNATAIDQIDGVVVAFSNANPQIYEVWDTGQWHDDSPSDEPLPYTCRLAMGYRGTTDPEFGTPKRTQLWAFDKVFNEGYITPGTTLNLQVNYGYEGLSRTINAVVNSASEPGYLFLGAGLGLGDSSLGDEPLGDQLSPTSSGLFKYKVINSIGLFNCFEWQVVLSSDTADAQWEVLAMGDNSSKAPEEVPGYLINKQVSNTVV